MKYRIEITGRGGEIVIGRVSHEVYDYFETNCVSIEDFACDWDEVAAVPEQFQPFPPGEWSDCDDVAHGFGTDPDYTVITVTDEDGIVVLDHIDYSGLVKIGAKMECEFIDPEDILEVDETYFVAQSFEKGLFYTFEVESYSFEASRLTVMSTDIAGWELVTGLRYNSEDLVMNTDVIDTDTTGFEAALYIIEEDTCLVLDHQN
jgi:hypothetical protein